MTMKFLTCSPRFGRCFFKLAAVCVLLYAAAIFVQTRTGNFHVVLKDELYRSGQLTPQQLEKAIQVYGIRTVYNLRGMGTGQDWYEKEKAIVTQSGGTFIDFPMKASEVLSDEKAHALMDTLKDARKPILVHCKAGADRTGLAVALYMAGVAGKGEEASEGQLSIRFGHISLPFLSEFNMDQTFENLESFFKYEGS